MTAIPGINGTTSTTNSKTGAVSGTDLRDVDMDEFLGLLITELQNQDPLNPMDNADMLAQISTIREIGSNNQLSETLSGFATGQQLSMASSLIGKQISGLDTSAKEISGTIDRVSVQTDSSDPTIRKVSVHVGDSIVDMNNIREIIAN